MQMSAILAYGAVSLMSAGRISDKRELNLKCQMYNERFSLYIRCGASCRNKSYFRM